MCEKTISFPEFSVSRFFLNILHSKPHPPNSSQSRKLHIIPKIKKMRTGEQILPHPVPSHRKIKIEFFGGKIFWMLSSVIDVHLGKYSKPSEFWYMP